MDISSIMGTILGSESIENVARKTGASKKDVTSVLTSALPQLLNGANKQSTDSDTAESFAGALNQHAKDDTSNIASFFSKVDLADGAKIVGHLLGGNSGSVASSSGVSADNSNNIMSAAAPLLMSLLGKQTQSSSNNQTNASNVGGLIGGLLGKTDIVGLAGSLLGGDSKQGAKKTATTAKKPAATAKKPSATGRKPASATKSATASAKKPAVKPATASGKKGVPEGAKGSLKSQAKTGAVKKTAAAKAQPEKNDDLLDNVSNVLGKLFK